MAAIDAARSAWANNQEAIIKPYLDEFNAAVEAFENEIPELKAAKLKRDQAVWAEGWKRLRVLFGKAK